MSVLRLTVNVPLGALLSLISTIVFSAQSSSPPPPASPVSLGGVLQVLFGLVVVLATVAATAWLLKRLGPGRVSAGGAIKLIGGIAVGPKERVVVVEVGETWLVVGVAPGQVSALHNMPKIAVSPEVQAVGEPGFSFWLRKIMNQQRAAVESKSMPGQSTDA